MFVKYFLAAFEKLRWVESFDAMIAILIGLWKAFFGKTSENKKPPIEQNALSAVAVYYYVMYGYLTWLGFISIHLYTARYGGLLVPSFSTAIPIRFNGILAY